MKWLYKQEEMDPSMMKADEVKKFISTTAEVLNKGIDEVLKETKLDDISIQRLKESNYVFSGIKTFHEMNEAFPSMLDDNGDLIPFEQFLKSVQSINETYNGTYLKAEWNFARRSAIMADKWQGFMNLDPDRYMLQYRTSADERVRKAHRPLHDITLPITSPFWDLFFPPNGWGCRCNVVAVRKGKYTQTDEKYAMDCGNQATTGKYEEMFRFNPGKKMACFPAYNAYTIKSCEKCKDNGYLNLAANAADNELCAVCRIVRSMFRKKEDN